MVVDVSVGIGGLLGDLVASGALCTGGAIPELDGCKTVPVQVR
jgi:hypothetical protein